MSTAYYFDYTANTPVDPDVAAAYGQAALDYPGNPNSTHHFGVAAREKLEDVLSSVGDLLKVSPKDLILTSGATEANNLALKGAAESYRHKGRHIISTPLEHSSVAGTLTALQEKGWEIDLLEIQRDGRIDVEELKELLREDTVLVSLCAVDSELGTIQPVAEVAEVLTEAPLPLFHVDATQALGKLPVAEVHALFAGADLVSLAPHKFYGLNGAGLLYKREGVVLTPQLSGGTSTTLYRSGTPDVPAAVALELALRKALDEQDARYTQVADYNERLRTALSRYEGVRFNSPPVGETVPHILNISVAGVRGDTFQKALAAEDICVSVKSACSVPGTPSRPVFAVSRDRKNALSSFRISLSHLTTKEDLVAFLEAFELCYRNHFVERGGS